MKKMIIFASLVLLLMGMEARGEVITYIDHEVTGTGTSTVVTEVERTVNTDDEDVIYSTEMPNFLNQESGNVELYNKTVVLNDNHVFNNPVVCWGMVNIILCDGYTMNCWAMINVASGHTLNIYVKKGSTGKLVAKGGDDNAGIGSIENVYAGKINIHGGTIEATGGENGAGIGGGNHRGFDVRPMYGGLTIYDGNVTATGGEYGAGIGSGNKPESSDYFSGYVTIYGGTVNATGGDRGAGIGGGKHGHGTMFTMYDGSVTAQTGFESTYAAGLGGGDEGNSSTIRIYGGTVVASGADEGAAGIGSGQKGICSEISIYGGNITATAHGGGGAAIGSGSRGKCENIYIGGNSTVVKATALGVGPAIGAGASRDDGNFNIVITGGDITANGSKNGAGIGSGDGGSFDGRIEISGGIVRAYSRKDENTGEVLGWGAGIGGGLSAQREMHGKIIISGGNVTAESRGGAGIGGGEGGILAEDYSITITGGTIDAKSKEGGAIGAGYHFLSESGDDATHSLLYRAYCMGKINISGNPSINLYTNNERYHYTPIEIHPDKGGSLTVNDNLMVSNIDPNNDAIITISSAENRVKALTTVDDYEAQPVAHKARIEPCTHGSYTYTIKDNTQHTARCIYCGYETVENHATEGTCDCGYDTGVAVYDVTLNTCDGLDGHTYNEPVQAKVAEGKKYILPECLLVPADYEFIGWVETTNGSSITQQEGETLRQPGYEITVTANVTYYARYKMTDIILADDTENGATIRNYDDCPVHSVTLAGRKLYKDNSWNTLCLPFDLDDFTGTPLAGAIVKTLEGASFDETNGQLTLNFSTTNLTAIKAGKPYIVKWTSGTDITNPVFNNVTIEFSTADVETTPVTFKGLYAPLSIGSEGDNTKLYLAADNKAYYPNGAMTIGCQRAYFQLNGITAGDKANEARAFVLNFGDATTEVKEVIEVKEVKDNSWYTLDGRRLNSKPTQKGIYINNGKKEVIK